MTFWIAAVLLPLVGGLHTYALAYGYGGLSREAAWDRAWKNAAVLAFVSVLCAIARLSGT